MLPIRIDFYLLDVDEPQARWLMACKLLEKAYHAGNRVYVHCQNQKDAEYLDELLWNFKPESFIPHNLRGEGPEPPPPIQIGFNEDIGSSKDVLFNLSDEIPIFHQRFRRIIEIVGNREHEKELGRAHYRIYRAKNYQLHTHTLKSGLSVP